MKYTVQLTLKSANGESVGTICDANEDALCCMMASAIAAPISFASYEKTTYKTEILKNTTRGYKTV